MVATKYACTLKHIENIEDKPSLILNKLIEVV